MQVFVSDDGTIQLNFNQPKQILDVLKTAEITGTFQQSSIRPDERRQLLAELHQLQNQLAELKAKAKKEAELSRLVEINMQAKTIESAINKTRKMLGE